MRKNSIIKRKEEYHSLVIAKVDLELRRLRGQTKNINK